MATSNAPHIPPFRPRARTHFWNYPRPYRTGWKAWLPSWRFVVGVMLAGASTLGGVVMAAWINLPVPAAMAEVGNQSTIVYWSDGSKLGEIAAEKRQIVTPDEIGENWDLITGTLIASEDQTFRTNLGVDFVGIARSAVNNLRGGAQQGGSTLTQQYVETYLTGLNTGYDGKFREVILALKVAQEEDKDVILERYLNTIYFGRGAYGIEAGAQAYFGKSASKLDYNQVAFLVGIIPSPNQWDGTTDPEYSRSWVEGRWERSIGFMASEGVITADDAAAAKFPEPRKYTAGGAKSGQTGYLIEEVKRELKDPDGAALSEDDLLSDGYKIYTTLDKKMQAAATETGSSIPTTAPDAKVDKKPGKASKWLRSSVVTIDPANGAIRALYGGPDYANPFYQTNAATQDTSQAASTFKPFTLVAALDQGISMGQKYNGDSPQQIPGWSVLNKDTGQEEEIELGNFDHESFGQIDLADATKDSVNTVYAQLNVEVGPDATRQAAIDAGIPLSTDGPAQLANVLGTDNVTTLQLARAYATFAAQGVRTDPHLVKSVTTLDDEKRFATPIEEERVFDEEIMAGATYAMQQVVEDGSGVAAQELGRPVAGKTGSSNENKSAWFAGYTPQYATVVGLYQYDRNANTYRQIQSWGDYEAMGWPITGGTWPASAWTEYMQKVYQIHSELPIAEFPEYEYEPVMPSPSPTPTDQPETVQIPGGLSGRPWPDVQAELVALGLNPQPREVEGREGWDPNTVVRVHGEGQEVEVSSTVEVEITGAAEVGAAVPEVRGLDQRAAENELRRAGFGVDIQTQASEQPEGTVVEQNPGPGSQAGEGSTVTIWVSDGSLGEPSDGATCGVFGNQPCDEPSNEPTGEPSNEPGPGGGNGNGGG
ncbi:transglycosylase domain-containing protein [Myceligenerans xiligouense]|uniref:Membrane peptidoglycan carboxypeptidase n=1 Tax=Myceligenerans xiligouense TaxID=253184 RepID=A0A3N4YS05_9MICO|nr:transglycosylase domain-containing protein [Myceligenerans xiligouense]RPF23333.1 membrane peptidoglycan carboxypeptidase [Myceligenerans xiligouense]